MGKVAFAAISSKITTDKRNKSQMNKQHRQTTKCYVNSNEIREKSGLIKEFIFTLKGEYKGLNAIFREKRKKVVSNA